MKRIALFCAALLFSLAAHAADVTKQGIFAIVHADLENGTGTRVPVVHEDNGKDTKLILPKGKKEPPRGAKIKVTGSIDHGKMTVKKLEVIAPAVAPLTSTSSLYILVNFLNNTAQPFTQAAVQAVAVNDTNSVQKFYEHVSYGQEQFAVTVTPWLTANMNVSTTCDYTAIATAANAAATAAGIAVANYKYKMYVFPANSACGWLGLAYLGAPYYAFSNGRNSGQVFTHEQGHNHALDHAGTSSCAGGCSVVEYGDPYDTMGNKAMMSYNAFQKSLIGWIPASQVAVQAGGTNSYTLQPIELAGGTTYAVKIPTKSANRTYWIEYRQNVGAWDTSGAGVHVRVARPFETTTGYDDTHLIGAPLAAGAVYTDATYGVTVTVASADATAAVVNVTSPVVPVVPPPPCTQRGNSGKCK